MIEFSEDDVNDFTMGAGILGTGGGGDPRKGAEVLLEDLKAGRRLRLCTIEELIGSDGVLVVPYLVGTIAQSHSQQEGISDLIKIAIKTFETKIGERVIGTVATEVGGLNSAMALHAAAHVGIPMVDADVVGRAAPETCHTVLNLWGIPLVPAVVALSPENVILLTEWVSSDKYESSIRDLSTKANRYVAVVDSPCRPGVVKDILVRGTMSKSVAVGRVRREAVQDGRDPISAVEREIGGRLVFSGVISGVKTRNEGGFLKGTATLSGTGRWDGENFESMIINEHIMAWRNGRPIVMPPDCFAFLDSDGCPIMNNTLAIGLQAHVLAWPSPPQWQTKKGLDLFGPRHFALGYDYVPFEKLSRI